MRDSTFSHFALAKLALILALICAPAPATAGEALASPLALMSLPGKVNPLHDVVFTSEGGQTVAYGEFAGKVVVLNVWATWCLPCREEMPSLDRLRRAVPETDVAILPVSVDGRGVDAVIPFYKEENITALPILTASGAEMVARLGDRIMPFTVIFDRSGREIGRVRGPAAWDDPGFVSYLEALAKVK